MANSDLRRPAGQVLPARAGAPSVTVYDAHQRHAIERILEAIEAALIEFPSGSTEHECFAACRDALLQAIGERRLRALA